MKNKKYRYYSNISNSFVRRRLECNCTILSYCICSPLSNIVLIFTPFVFTCLLYSISALLFLFATSVRILVLTTECTVHATVHAPTKTIYSRRYKKKKKKKKKCNFETPKTNFIILPHYFTTSHLSDVLAFNSIH